MLISTTYALHISHEFKKNSNSSINVLFIKCNSTNEFLTSKNLSFKKKKIRCPTNYFMANLLQSKMQNIIRVLWLL